MILIHILEDNEWKYLKASKIDNDWYDENGNKINKDFIYWINEN